LVNGQTDGTQDGIYVVTAYSDGAATCVLTRASSAKNSNQMLTGSMVTVTEGTVYAKTVWMLTFAAGADAGNDGSAAIVGNSTFKWLSRSTIPAAPGTTGVSSVACSTGEQRMAAGALYICTGSNFWQKIPANDW